MKRTTIMLPNDLRVRAVQRAAELGLSMGEYIRRALVVALDEADATQPETDSLFADQRVFGGAAPFGLAEQHDRHLYAEQD